MWLVGHCAQHGLHHVRSGVFCDDYFTPPRLSRERRRDIQYVAGH